MNRIGILALSIAPLFAAHVAQATEVVDESKLHQSVGKQLAIATRSQELGVISSLPTQTSQWAQAQEESLVQITGLTVNSTPAGVEVVIQASDVVMTPTTSTVGNALIIEVPAAVLALPEGEEFLEVSPVEGIAAITASNAVTQDGVRIVVTGTDAPPVANVQSLGQQLVVDVAIAPAAAVSQADVPDSRIRVTVTGTRNPDEVDDVPSNVTVIDREEIDRTQARDIRDLIRYEPGIVVRDNPRYGLQDFNIRGLDGNRVLLQVDGIRLPTRFEFGPFALGRDYVDIETLSAVEIIRGPASALYGSDALAGVVSYLSLDPEALLDAAGEDTLGGISVGYDSDTTGTFGNFLYAARFGDLDMLVSYTRRDRNELRVSGDDTFVDPETNTRNNFFTSSVLRLSDTQSLRLIAEIFDDDVELDVLERNFVSPDIQSEDVEFSTNRERISLAYEYDNPDSNSFLQFGRIQAYFQNSRNEELRVRRFTYGPFSGGQFPVGTPIRRNDDYDFLDRIWGANLQLRSDFELGAIENRLTYGVEISTTRNERPRDRVETSLITGESTRISDTDTFPIDDFPPSDTFRLGFFAQNEITFGNDRFTVIPGLRFDIYELTVEDSPSFERNDVEPVDFEDSDVSPSLALVYRPSDEITLVGRYARGFRAPLYSEINSGFTNTTGAFFKYRTIPNPDLESETSNTFELSVRGDFDRFRFGLTGFYSRYNNFIEQFVPAGTELITPPPGFGTPVINIFQTQNIDDAEIYGVELGGEYRFSSGEDGFRLRLAAAWTEGRNLTDDRPLESVSPFQLVAGLGYQSPGDRWGAELITTVVGEPDVEDTINDQERFIPDAYALVDVIGYINISPDVTLSLGIYNLLDTEYYQFADVRTFTADRPDIGRFSQSGTSFRAGLTWRF